MAARMVQRLPVIRIVDAGLSPREMARVGHLLCSQQSVTAENIIQSTQSASQASCSLGRFFVTRLNLPSALNPTSSVHKSLFLSLPRTLDVPGGTEPFTKRLTRKAEV
jgi:hypothetical protein